MNVKVVVSQSSERQKLCKDIMDIVLEPIHARERALRSGAQGARETTGEEKREYEAALELVRWISDNDELREAKDRFLIAEANLKVAVEEYQAIDKRQIQERLCRIHQENARRRGKPCKCKGCKGCGAASGKK